MYSTLIIMSVRANYITKRVTLCVLVSILVVRNRRDYLDLHEVRYAVAVAPFLESVAPSAATVGSVVEVGGLCLVAFG